MDKHQADKLKQAEEREAQTTMLLGRIAELTKMVTEMEVDLAEAQHRESQLRLPEIEIMAFVRERAAQISDQYSNETKMHLSPLIRDMEIDPDKIAWEQKRAEASND